MKTRHAWAWRAWLLVALLAASGSSWAVDLQAGVPALRADVVVLDDTGMRPDELDEFQRQPPAERRRRADAILALRPQATGVRFLRLQADDALADFPGMLADSELVLADSAIDRRLRKIVLVTRAEALIQAQRAAEAIPLASQAIEIVPTDSNAWFARGWARYQVDQDRTDDALADLDRALQLEPDEGVGRYRRAVVLASRGALDRAAQDYERAVQLVPEDEPARREYGVLLIERGAPEAALAQFEVALRLRPGDPSAWVGREHAHLVLKRFDDVVADAREAMALGGTDSDLANAHSYLATALWKKSDFAGAAREFQSVLAFTDDHRIAKSVGQMQWFSGQLPQAIQTFRGQVTWPDSNPYTLLYLFILQVHVDPAAEAAATAELASLATPHQPHEWGDTLVDLVLGRTTLAATLVEADAADTDRLRAGHRCEADYFAAERLLLHGQREAASGLLEEAHSVCPSTYIEAQAVAAERQRLAAQSPSH
ncbi:tetratricopeptide repeat protein [Scleromatobacter humisilvae]|uniref:Tetratricopeptide repeat protein n=1 Tax=Scleromatobacter humisilvae TaxID=2897159 RepID=A0A9X1YLW3_9BURK|nr:tetratricopeptide repeat protein [Scleromatobacter humisilvae]MCK9688724.1 tetratricopeptide repeat protein [Scleromatobacter humisilvae]